MGVSKEYMFHAVNAEAMIYHLLCKLDGSMQCLKIKKVGSKGELTTQATFFSLKVLKTVAGLDHSHKDVSAGRSRCPRNSM